MHHRPLLIMFLAAAALFAGLFQPSDVLAQTKKRPVPKKVPAGTRPTKPRTLLPTGAARDDIEVAPVRASMRDSAVKAAATIDSLVALQLRRNRIQQNEMTTDEQFVRRIYLDIVGTIPTARDVEVFLDSNDKDKRNK